MAGYLILGGFILALICLLVYRWIGGKKKLGYRAHVEYWIYTEATSLPIQEVLMDRMISANPHNRKGQASIGAREGLLFTDIRLHLGLSKRPKNPHIFRPDLFDKHAIPTPDILERLAEAQSMIRCKYVSEAVLKDTRHLQFMAHYVDATAELTGSTIILDQICEQFYTFEEFHNLLAMNNNAERPEFHSRVVWMEDENGFYAQSLGLRKIGINEVRTVPQDGDNEILVTGLVMRLVYHLYRNPELQEQYEFDEFDDIFVVRLEPNFIDGVQTVKIGRKSTISN